jgi:anaerobic magnesium-protoporphyrin IX monomethyl ester cyclase
MKDAGPFARGVVRKIETPPRTRGGYPCLGVMHPVRKRVLIVNPPSGLYRRDDRCQSRVEDQTVRIVFPPIDLAMLAAVARREGAEARIGDYPARGAGWEQYKTDLREFAPDLVLFTVTTATIDADCETARIARERDAAIRTVARGELFERQGEAIFERFAALDLAIYGEVEETFARIVRDELPNDFVSALYRDPESGRIVRRPGRAVIADLDALPLPARDLLDNTLYRSPETGNPLTVIHANRGCPSKCIFCPAGPLSDYRLRLRSPQSIVGELRECVEKFGIREFLFNGDTFTMNKRWVLELCDGIARAGLDVRWGCNSRVDTMDSERAEAMRRAGCWVVAFGVESGDQDLLDRMKKGTKLDAARKAIATAKAAGLATHVFILIGLPWETRETLRRTYDFIRELDTDFFDINIATPLPGTELYDIVVREGLYDPETSETGNYAHAVMGSYTLDKEFLTRWRRRALLRLYFRPHYIIRTLRRASRTGTLRHYLTAAVARLKGLVGG